MSTPSLSWLVQPNFRPAVSTNGYRINQFHLYDQEGIWTTFNGLHVADKEARTEVMELFAGDVRSARKLNFSKGDTFTFKTNKPSQSSHSHDLYIFHPKVEGEEYRASEYNGSIHYHTRFRTTLSGSVIFGGEMKIVNNLVLRDSRYNRSERNDEGERIDEFKAKLKPFLSTRDSLGEFAIGQLLAKYDVKFVERKD